MAEWDGSGLMGSMDPHTHYTLPSSPKPPSSSAAHGPAARSGQSGPSLLHCKVFAKSLTVKNF